jgi:hypothetical protein
LSKMTRTAANGSYTFYKVVLGKGFTVTIVGTVTVAARSSSALNGSILLDSLALGGRDVALTLPSGTTRTTTNTKGAFSLAVSNTTKKAVTYAFTLAITAASPICLTAPDCNDSNTCTDDTCTSSHRCAYANNTKTCNDGKFCTIGDTCSGGKCVGSARNCGDPTDCTSDACNETTDTCDNLCTAASLEDACCDDPQCEGAASCAFPGGTFLFRIASISQADPSCLMDQNTLNWLLSLLEGLGLNSFEISIPTTTDTPVWVTIPLPLLGTINVAAVFTGRSLMILPGQTATADLGVAGGGLLGLNCAITGEPSGGVFWNSPALNAQIDLSQMTVAPGAGSGACTLSTPAPACTMSFDIEQVP